VRGAYKGRVLKVWSRLLVKLRLRFTALVLVGEHLASLEDQARNEDMDPDERLELLDRIRRGRRFISPVGA